MKKGLQILVCALGVSLASATVFAQGQSKGHANRGQGAGQGDDDRADQDKTERNHDQDNGARRNSTIFSPRDRRVITDYFRNRNSNLPPGLAKRNGNLPPGLQKQLDRNGTLPPGLQKRLQPFPGDLESRLPRLPAGYNRGVIGDDVVIINSKTQRIIDIIHAVTGR